MYSDHREAAYGTRTRTPVSHFGLTPPPSRKRAASYLDSDLMSSVSAFPTQVAPVRTVTLAGVRATQPSVINRALRAHSRTPGKLGYHKDAHPLLLISNGERYLWDGHHRTCLALASGATEMPMRVMDFDDPHVRAVTAWNAAEHERIRAALSREIDRIVREHGPIFPCRMPESEALRQYRAARKVAADARAVVDAQMPALIVGTQALAA